MTDDHSDGPLGGGCPLCDWQGTVTITHDRDHEYYTHLIVRDGEVFKGTTCSRRTRPRRPGLVARLRDRLGW